jgi:hypothetical protein
MCDVPKIEKDIRFYSHSVDNAGYPTLCRFDIVGKRQLNLTNDSSIDPT